MLDLLRCPSSLRGSARRSDCPCLQPLVVRVGLIWTAHCCPTSIHMQEADLQRHKQRLVKQGKLPEEPSPTEGQEQAAAGRQQGAAGGRATVCQFMFHFIQSV